MRHTVMRSRWCSPSRRHDGLAPTPAPRRIAGIMMKKFAALSKEMDEVSEEIKRMGDKQKGLRLQIAVRGLECCHLTPQAATAAPALVPPLPQELEKEIGVLKLMMHEKV